MVIMFVIMQLGSRIETLSIRTRARVITVPEDAYMVLVIEDLYRCYDCRDCLLSPLSYVVITGESTWFEENMTVHFRNIL